MIKLSEHFTYRKLIRFTLPSVVMMIFTSIYGVVDGFFVSNYVGKTSFAAVNIIFPFLMILGAIGFMFGTGGSALISKTMGEGDNEKANSIFSLLIYISSIVGVVVAVFGIVFTERVAKLLGADGKLLDDCVVYGRIILSVLPAYVLQMEFQSFFIAAEKPKLGLYMTVVVGATNMVLDAVLVAVFPFGLAGAAVATAVSQLVGGIFPVFYFASKNNSLLKLGKTQLDGGAIFKTCTNGSSELMSNISMSLVSMLYNVQLIEYAGENGVAAYGVLMYVNMIFLAAFIGYSIGTAPVMSYHYGAENYSELKGLLRKSMFIILVLAVGMVALALVLGSPLSHLFVGYDPELLALTKRAFSIFSFSFLFSGFAIFSSCFFTALNDGITSAAISFLRTLVFQVAAVVLLPMIWELDGIWFSIVVAEFMAVVIGMIFLKIKRNDYHY